MRARWMLAVALTLSGCFDSGDSAAPRCQPSCRDGFTCVFGTCLSLCNPPCGAGSSCVPIDSERGMCVTESDVAVAPTDAVSPDVVGDDAPVNADDVVVTPGDAPAPEDAPAPDDAVTRSDVASDVVDAVAPADRPDMDVVDLDAPTLDAGGARDVVDAAVVVDRPSTDAPRDVADAGRCGHPTEACCAGIGCFPGSYCVGERCVAYTPLSNECQSNQDCGSSLTCVGGRSCGANPDWRWCYQCLPNAGVARFGETCRTYSDCATGVCSFGRCTYACDLSGPGDGQCASFGVRSGTCAQITFGLPPVSDAGVPRALQLQGVCEQGCARNRDCAGGTACVPISDELLDRVVFICATSRATAQAGTPCMWGEDCQSGMCIGGANPAGGAACSAPCVDDADCPTTAPVCSTIRLYTSNGTAIPSRGCLPRRM